MESANMHIILKANGLVYRARNTLLGTPKPWPKQVRDVSKLMAQAQGMLTDEWRRIRDNEERRNHPGSTPADSVADTDSGAPGVLGN